MRRVEWELHEQDPAARFLPSRLVDVRLLAPDVVREEIKPLIESQEVVALKREVGAYCCCVLSHLGPLSPSTHELHGTHPLILHSLTDAFKAAEGLSTYFPHTVDELIGTDLLCLCLYTCLLDLPVVGRKNHRVPF